ncbi:MAG: acetylornithine/succinylornithine family transaminase [Clostridia bacterium]|nr:acetylornithine/succinylornithine family transaminase [Clostridia bacterium]
MDTKAKTKEYVANTYGRFDVEAVRGAGSLIYDEEGREYIDLGSGIAVNTFGVADSEWVEAVTRQAMKIQHASNLYYTKPGADLAEALSLRTGMKKVFFSNSGAEANECAIKVARKWAADNKGAEYFTIITLENSFHGRTITTLAATGQDVFHKDFTPLTDGFVTAKANDIESVKQAIANNKVAAVMMEAIQGEGGVVPLEKDFVEAVCALASEHDFLVIFDEVQTGNGRSGALYAYMNFGVTPDIVSTAKGLAGGLPLGATLLGERVKDTLTPGLHGSTFGANPVCSAAALSVLSRIDDALLGEVREKSQYIFDTLSGKPGIEGVTGMGLMIGIKTSKDASEVVAKCQENGVLVLKAKDKVRLLPALNIPFDLLKQAIDIIIKAAE